jgi:hypothetical protein
MQYVVKIIGPRYDKGGLIVQVTDAGTGLPVRYYSRLPREQGWQVDCRWPVAPP